MSDGSFDPEVALANFLIKQLLKLGYRQARASWKQYHTNRLIEDTLRRHLLDSSGHIRRDKSRVEVGGLIIVNTPIRSEFREQGQEYYLELTNTHISALDSDHVQAFFFNAHTGRIRKARFK